jgi:GxxExxY protein
MNLEYVAKQLVDAGYKVHKELGPGLMKSVYCCCLIEECRLRGVQVGQEVILPLFYRGKRLNKQFRIDLLVEVEIIIEVKAVEILLPVHTAQLISYLRLSGKRIEFLISFHVPLFKDGIRRFVNNY